MPEDIGYYGARVARVAPAKEDLLDDEAGLENLDSHRHGEAHERHALILREVEEVHIHSQPPVEHLTKDGGKKNHLYALDDLLRAPLIRIPINRAGSDAHLLPFYLNIDRQIKGHNVKSLSNTRYGGLDRSGNGIADRPR